MAKTNKRLDYWEEQIKNYPRLKIDTAKSLYIEAMKETDISLRQEKLNMVVEGTLYVVLNFVKRNNLAIIDNVKYSIDDIINECNELWIKAIYEGVLLDVNSFAKILDTSFCTDLAAILNDHDFTVSDLTVLKTNCFDSFLYEFIEFDKTHGFVSYEDFCHIVSKIFGYEISSYIPYIEYSSRMNDFGLSDSGLLRQTYELALNIVDAIKDENDDIEITKTKIDKFKYLLIESGLERFRVNMDLVYQDDFSDSLLDYIVRKEFKDAVLSSKELDDRKKGIITKFCGLNDSNVMTLDGIGKEYNITTERTRQLLAKAERFARKDPNVRKYKGI